MGFCPDVLVILPDPDNTNSNRGVYAKIGSYIYARSYNSSSYNAKVTITSTGFDFETIYNSTQLGPECTSGPHHTIFAAKY